MKIQKDLSKVSNINKEIRDSSAYLLDLRLKKSTSQMKDTSEFKKVRRYIAKLNTYINNKR